MDRTEAYRILGLREGATRTEMRLAYTERLRKYHTPDYQDEPEYAQRKINEAKYAYNILAGGAVPSSEKQRLEHHERRKDDMEIEEITDNPLEDIVEKLKAAAAKVKAGNFIPHNEGSHSHNTKKDRHRSGDGFEREKRQYGGASAKSFGMPQINAETVKKFMAVFVVCVSVFPTMIAFCMSNDVQDFYDISVSDDVIEAVDALMYERAGEYDFYGHLGERKDSYTYAYDIASESEDIDGSFAQTLAMQLGVIDSEEAIAYLCGDGSFFAPADDYEATCYLAEGLMNAPTFEELVGMQNLYRNELIWDYGSYMRFLIDVASDQTYTVLYG